MQFDINAFIDNVQERNPGAFCFDGHGDKLIVSYDPTKGQHLNSPSEANVAITLDPNESHADFHQRFWDAVFESRGNG